MKISDEYFPEWNIPLVFSHNGKTARKVLDQQENL